MSAAHLIRGGSGFRAAGFIGVLVIVALATAMAIDDSPAGAQDSTSSDGSRRAYEYRNDTSGHHEYSSGGGSGSTTAGGSTCSSGTAEITVTTDKGTRHSTTGGNAACAAPASAPSRPATRRTQTATSPLAKPGTPTPQPTALATAAPTSEPQPQIVLGYVGRATGDQKASRTWPVRNSVLLAMALALGGGSFVLLHRRRRFIQHPTPVLWRIGPASPSALPFAPSEPSPPAPTTLDAPRPRQSSIVELYFVAETKSGKGPQVERRHPTGPITEADAAVM